MARCESTASDCGTQCGHPRPARGSLKVSWASPRSVEWDSAEPGEYLHLRGALDAGFKRFATECIRGARPRRYFSVAPPAWASPGLFHEYSTKRRMTRQPGGESMSETDELGSFGRHRPIDRQQLGHLVAGQFLLRDAAQVKGARRCVPRPPCKCRRFWQAVMVDAATPALGYSMPRIRTSAPLSGRLRSQSSRRSCAGALQAQCGKAR